MPVQSSLVRFQLSGGTANENPNLSLGGDISVATNRNIVSNFLHNLFDEVINTEAVTGEYEYRHFYYRNGADFKVRNARLMILADQTSVWSKLEFAKGTANNGLVEQAIPDENTAPVGISDTNWRIPNSLNPLLLGDLEADSVASIWIRRKVEVGSLIAKNEKVTIRIIADPPVPIAPPVECPAGQHYDTATEECVDDEEEPDDCPEGQHRDPNGVCIDNTGTPCPEGTILVEGQCVPVGSPPPPEPVKIMIAGDIGCNGDAENVIRQISEVPNISMFIANGDLSYSSTVNCFMDILDENNLIEITKITIGNHDDDEDGSTALRNEFVSQFQIPSVGYYATTIQNIHIIFMDTQSNYALNSQQYTLVRNDLIVASQNASIDWIVVCYHKPSITISSQHAALTDFRDIYHPLFDQYHVDVVVAGHNHNFQRTYPIRYNASSPSTPTIVNSTAGPYINVDGRIFINAGTGGRALDDLGSVPSHYIYSNDEDFGYLYLEWTNNNKTLLGAFIAVTSSTGSTILSQFNVQKT